jgi:DNA-binding MarR family transcriptional regulator
MKERRAVVPAKPLSFDPIGEAWDQWVNSALRRFDLSFARFELLALLSFTRKGSLPLSKVGARLQVQPASVTHVVDRLEVAGMVCRVPHDTDRRATLVKILPPGRALVRKAVKVLNDEVFCDPGLPGEQARSLVDLIATIRLSEGDFVS